jgi:succinate dehydrogenase/fumarate reductase flavoprotein subunit
MRSDARSAGIPACMFTDVLVIGGGGAGLRAAIEADALGAKVLLLTKGKLGRSGVTAIACSDRMAFHVTLPETEPGGPDNWRYHADDIYAIGGSVSDYDLAETLARNSADAFYFLDNLGVPFVRKDGKPDQFVTDGSKYARACYTGPRTANEIEAALLRHLRQTDVRVIEDAMAVELILDREGKAVVGAFCMDTSSDAFFAIEAGSTILATGGAGSAFKVNVYPEGMTGDGYSLAYRAGAELVNLEFIQIGLSSVKTKLACSGSLMRAVPRFVNDAGEEFLAKYFPASANLLDIHCTVFQKGASWPVSQREPSRIIDIAVSREIARGKRVFLDYGSNPAGFDLDALPQDIQQRYEGEKKAPVADAQRKGAPFHRLREINPDSIAWLKEHGVDLEVGDAIEIAPAAQHFQGGVKINRLAETTVRNLYAAGECAGGQHGANRPGGNALMDCQVFGKIAGARAAENARARSSEKVTQEMVERCIKSIQHTLEKPSAESASSVREKVQSLLSSAAGVIRTEKGLSDAITQVEELSRAGVRPDEKGLAFAVETLGILDTTRMVMGAALRRKESRGPHLFFASPDSPDPLPRNDRDWREYIVISRRDGQMIFEKKLPVRKPGPDS